MPGLLGEFFGGGKLLNICTKLWIKLPALFSTAWWCKQQFAQLPQLNSSVHVGQ